MRSPRSDAEKLARGRVLIGVLLIYLASMGFLALGDILYAGGEHVILSRLAVIPFFLLLVRRFARLVRVRPPTLLEEARHLLLIGRYEAARDRFAQVRELGAETARLDRARRLLQDGLALTAAQEALLNMGRCSLALGEVERSARELEEVRASAPARADVAIELAEVLVRLGAPERATEVLRSATPHFDELDLAALREQPSFTPLLKRQQLPQRSLLQPKITRERVLAAALAAGAVLHGLHLYGGFWQAG